MIMVDVKTKTVKPLYVADFFKMIDEAKTKAERKALLELHCKHRPFDMLLYLNFNPNIQLDIPEGPPPFKRDTQTHPDLMSPLVTQISYLKACVVSNKNLAKMKKEKIFMDVCEAVPPCDADILIACKDRQLETLYPNITRELVGKSFPNYVG